MKNSTKLLILTTIAILAVVSLFVLQSKLGVEESQTVKARTPGFSELSHWAEGTRAENDGATRDYYNYAGDLEWENYMGDWHDVNNVAQGSQPYAQASLSSGDGWVEWDVTNLVQEFVNGTYLNNGMFLRLLSGGACNFRSREYGDSSQRPQLVINDTITLNPEADTYLDSSTSYCVGGDSETLTVGSGRNLLIRFNLDSIGETIQSAKLRLFSYEQSSSATVCVFRCPPGHHYLPPESPTLGLAANYLGDQGIENDPDVHYFEDFEDSTWDDDWSYGWTGSKNTALVDFYPEENFEILQGKALRVIIRENDYDGLAISYYFLKNMGYQPEEIYFRYYLRLGSGWETRQGGKFPGLANAEDGGCASGGSPADGVTCWSARGHYLPDPPPGNPLEGTVPLGNYVYDARGTTYGVNYVWKDGYRGYVEKAKWYCIEQYIKMNTPGQNDGIMRAWVDGRLANEETDMKFRNVPELNISKIWFHVFHGGTMKMHKDVYFYADNLVIANQYIGPMASSPPPPCSGTCKPNPCNDYADCVPLTGICATGNCCQGTCTTPPVQTPDIALTKSVLVDGQPATQAYSGQELTYTITYTNSGSAEARNITIIDTIPQGATYVAGSASQPPGGSVSFSNNTLTWTIPSLAAGVQGSVSFKVKAD